MLAGSYTRYLARRPLFQYTKGSSKNHVTGGGGVSRSLKKLVSRAALKGFIRGMHGHGRSSGEGNLNSLGTSCVEAKHSGILTKNTKKKERKVGWCTGPEAVMIFNSICKTYR